MASVSQPGRSAFRELMEKKAAKIMMLDISWCGGIGEVKKIATMAEARHLPIAPHDCTGPVVFTASTHLSINAPNALVQEFVRAYYNGWYKELLTDLPTIADGHVSPPEGSGASGPRSYLTYAERPEAHLPTSKLGGL